MFPMPRIDIDPVGRMRHALRLHCIKRAALMNRIKRDEPVATIDVRTPAEAKVFRSTLPRNLSIPLNELYLFLPPERGGHELRKAWVAAPMAAASMRNQIVPLRERPAPRHLER
jgi:hypothetical protein